jgi:hypothetical protein
LADMLGFGISGAAYTVTLAVGVIVTAVALIARRLHGLPGMRLSGMDIVGPADLEEIALPKETVYLTPASVTSLDCRDEPLILLRLASVLGSGLTALALVGLSTRWVGSDVVRFVVALSCGVAVALLAYVWSAHWFFGRATREVACVDLVGASGEVIVSIPQDSFGAVAATVHGKRMTFSARAVDQSAISRGASVRVVHWAGGRVVVVPAKPEEPASRP